MWTWTKVYYTQAVAFWLYLLGSYCLTDTLGSDYVVWPWVTLHIIFGVFALNPSRWDKVKEYTKL